MYDYYRNIVNFISNIYDTIQMEKNDKNENELELHEYVYEENKLSPLQKMMNEKIVKNIFNDHLKKFYISVQRKFSKALNKSVIEYNKIFYEEPNNMNSFNKTNNENKNKSPTENETEIETEIETETKTKNPKELAIKAIIDKNEGDSFFCTNEFIKNRVFSLDEQVLESYYASDYNIKLLNSKYIFIYQYLYLYLYLYLYINIYIYIYIYIYISIFIFIFIFIFIIIFYYIIL